MAIQIAEKQENAGMDNRKLSRQERRKLKKQKILEEKQAEDAKKEIVVEKPEKTELEIKKEISEEQPIEQTLQKEILEEKPIVEEKALQESSEIKKEVAEEKSSIDKAMEVEKSESEEQPAEQPYKERPEAKEGAEQIESRPKARAAVIEDVKIAKITSLWKKKPKRLSLESDAIIITLKTPDGKILKETFYTHIDQDNNLKYGRTNTAHQQNFIGFIQHYKLAENLENYNVIDDSKAWKGKTVELDENSNIVIK